jgi:phosphoribosylformylglycinamidine cyclo-ligase
MEKTFNMGVGMVAVLPAGLRAELDTSTWEPAPIFGLIAERGRVAPEEMEKTFNMGVGMVAVVPAAVADAAVKLLTDRDVPAWVLGEIRTDS